AALQEPHIRDRRHARARRRGASARPDHGPSRVQRDLLHRRAGAEGEPPRRDRGRLAGGDDDAAARARHARLRACRDARRRGAQARRAGEGAQRERSHTPRPDRARVDRAPGAALHELPRADDAAEDRHPGAGGIDLEARLVGEQPAADEARARDPRLARAAHERRRRRRRLLAVPAASLARQHDRSRYQRDPAQHRRGARARPPEVALMDFSFSSEQDDLRREARAFLESNASPTMDQLADLGWVGILQSEEFSFVDAAVLFEELGRALYEGPYVLNEVAAQPDDDVWSIEIDGLVPHLDSVDRVLRPDMTAATASGEVLTTVDETLGLGRLSPDGSEPAQGEWPEVRRRLLAALALEAVGIGSKALELAIAYTADREQFGKKIGSYQAVSHSVVDGYVGVELGRSLAYAAAWAVAEGDEQAELLAVTAKAQATEAAVAACERSIQVHGGIGFTWEHPLHRYYKRALWLEGALGYGREHRAQVAQYLLSS